MRAPVWTPVDVSGWQPRDMVFATDCHPGHVTEWHCPPPGWGEHFTVTAQDWGTVDVELLSGPPTVTMTVIARDGSVTEVTGGERAVLPCRRVYAWEPA